MAGQPQQQGGSAPKPQQQGQAPAPSPQQSGAPIIRDWASI